MDRTQKRCLIGSVLLHGTLLAVLVTAAAFAPKPDYQDVPFLEILPSDLKLTDGDKVGGGNPQAKAPTPAITRPEPPPAEPPSQTPPPPITRSKPPIPERTEKIEKPAPVKPSRVSKAPPDAPKTETKEKAQDVDSTRKAKPVVQTADKKQKRPSAPDEAAQTQRAENEKRDREEREELERRKQAAEAANSQRREIAERLRSGASTISKNAGASTTIEMPGPGGQAYAPYISYLGLFYRERWKSPRSSSRAQAYVGASVEIAKDGTVVDYKITAPSGIREVDDSVREVLKRYSKLRPLPDTTTDPKRLFTIQFRLDADSNL